MSRFVLKVKTKSGQHIIDNLTVTSTFVELKQTLERVTNIASHKMVILSGFPPKPVESDQSGITLPEVNIKSGDTLIIEESNVLSRELHPTPARAKEDCFSSASSLSTANNHSIETQDKARPVEPSAPPRPQVPASEDIYTTPVPFSSRIMQDLESQEDLDGGLLMRQVVPADNSCLFTSVGFVLGGKIDTTCGSYMRQIIAAQVEADPENYSEAILGKPNKDYCQWILKPESWGGGIELAVLSGYYGLEIAVVDTMNAVISRFGEDKNYDYRVFLIFDGIHYDPLYREPIDADSNPQTLFITSNEKVLRLAEELAHEAKTSKQYTDVNRFTLRCLVCKMELTGQVQAQQHAQTSGHMNFGEIAS